MLSLPDGDKKLVRICFLLRLQTGEPSKLHIRLRQALPYFEVPTVPERRAKNLQGLLQEGLVDGYWGSKAPHRASHGGVARRKREVVQAADVPRIFGVATLNQHSYARMLV